MSSSSLVRWAGLAAMTAGVLLLVAELLELLPAFEDYPRPPDRLVGRSARRSFSGGSFPKVGIERVTDHLAHAPRVALKLFF